MSLAHWSGVILRTFTEPSLSQCSYLLGSEATGDAIVVDPIRRIDEYIEAAQRDGLRITTVVDTHLHADYVSGARALASRAGAMLAVSGLGGEHREYAFAGRRHVRTLVEGDVIRVGELQLAVRHTPQHAAEHISLLVTDGSVEPHRLGILAGDSPVPDDVLECPAWPTHRERPDSTCDRPRYFDDVERMNQRGSLAWNPPPRWEPVSLKALPELVATCTLFLDTRPHASESGFLPGSVVLPIDESFLWRAGSVLRYGMPIYVVSHTASDVARAAALLSLIGLDSVCGWVDGATVTSYAQDGGALQSLWMAAPRDAVQWLAEGALLLDVRGTREWRQHHLKHALHTPLSHVIDDVRDVDRDIPIVVYSEEEAAATVAATALRRAGFATVANLSGGSHVTANVI